MRSEAHDGKMTGQIEDCFDNPRPQLKGPFREGGTALLVSLIEDVELWAAS